MSFGVDLSDFRLVSNFDQARVAVDWMITKATDGTKKVHDSYDNNWRGFAPKPRGVYHFTECYDIPDEVAHFVSVWRKHPWEIDPVLDAECKGINSAYIKRWIAEFRRQTGRRRIGVYSGVSLFRGACNPAGFVDNDVWLWAARYRKTGRPTATAAGLGGYLGWWHPAVRIVQFDDATPLPGCPQTVDANLALGSITGTAATAASKEIDMQLSDPYDQKKWNDTPATVGHLLENLRQNLVATRNIVTQQTGTIKGLVSVVSKGSGLTQQQVQEAVTAAIKDAVVNVDVNVAQGSGDDAV